MDRITVTKTKEEWIRQAEVTLGDCDWAMACIEAKALNMRRNAESEIQTALAAARRSLRQAHVSWAQVESETADKWHVARDEIAAAWDLNGETFQRRLAAVRSVLG